MIFWATNNAAAALIYTGALFMFLLSPAAVRSQGTSAPMTSVNINGIDIKVGAMADTPEIVQWKILAARKRIASREQLYEQAHKNLEDAHKLPFKFQRVEVTGMWSSDDTSRTHPEMFDKQLKMSFLNELRNPGKIARAFQPVVNFAQDAMSALLDTQGKLSGRGKEILSELKGATANEVVAHSWGTEAVYAGILTGYINPPRKLIVIGVPEANEEKWRALAKYTGIEVHVVGFSQDKLQLAGNAAEYISGQIHAGLPRDGDKLEALWRKRCAQRNGAGCTDPGRFDRRKFDYNVNVPPPNVRRDLIIDLRLTDLDHDRMLYYVYLNNRKLFNKTIAQLAAPQRQLIKAEENRILSEAMAEARVLVAQAREQAGLANRKRDELLRETVLNIASRSCDAPGSVSQAELDRLPHPSSPDFYQRPVFALVSCTGRVFNSLGADLGRRDRLDAAEVRRLAMPMAVPVAAVPVTRPAQIRTEFPAEETVKNFRRLANLACASPEQLTEEEASRAIRTPYIPNAESAGADLSGCARFVYDAQVRFVREGQSVRERLTTAWLRNRVQDHHVRTAPPQVIQQDREPQAPEPGCFIDPSTGIRACPR